MIDHEIDPERKLVRADVLNIFNEKFSSLKVLEEAKPILMRIFEKVFYIIIRIFKVFLIKFYN